MNDLFDDDDVSNSMSHRILKTFTTRSLPTLGRGHGDLRFHVVRTCTWNICITLHSEI